MTHRLASSRIARAGLAALAALFIVACGGSDDEPSSGPTTMTIGAAGGTLDGPGGAQLVIPAGALSQATSVGIAQSGAGAPGMPAGGADVGAMFALTPHGTTFAVPVTIRVPFDPARLGAGEVPTLWKTNAAQTGWEEVAGATVSGNVMQAQITSFSWVVILTPLLPPSISVQPAPQSVTAPATATFAVGAASLVNSGPLAYQWRRNGAAIAGATGPTYTTGPTTVAADNGALYSVDVSNSVGTTASGSAALSVSTAPVTTAALTVTVTPANSGTVTSAPAGIACGADCTETYPLNTAVTLTATPAAGFAFSAWSPNCPAGAVTVSSGIACTATFVAAPAPPAPASALGRIAAGAGWSLAVDRTGVPYSWGTDAIGQLGNGAPSANQSTALAMGTLTSVRFVSASSQNASAAVRIDGTVWAWGYRGNVDCDVGSVPPPFQVVGASDIVAASVGDDHTLLRRADGAVLSYGCNHHGQLGRPVTGGGNAPREPASVVAGLPAIVAVAAGRFHSLALDATGRVWSWGVSGPGSLVNPNPSPALVPGLSGIVAIASGAEHAIFLTSDGSVLAWGSNRNGKLGDGTEIDRIAPTPTLLTSRITAIAAGGDNSLALRDDGVVLSWGINETGQLGSGSSSPGFRSQPGLVTGLSNVVAISMGAGLGHALALRGDGSVWSWGHNNAGQLGDGSTTARLTPVQVTGLNLN